MTTVINTSQAPAAIGPYSQAIKANGFIFVSGQLPVNPATGTMDKYVEKQTQQSLDNIKAILEHENSSMDKIVKTTVFIQDIKKFATINQAYTAIFDGDYPARSCVEVACLPKNAQVEIEAIAVE